MEEPKPLLEAEATLAKHLLTKQTKGDLPSTYAINNTSKDGQPSRPNIQEATLNEVLEDVISAHEAAANGNTDSEPNSKATVLDYVVSDGISVREAATNNGSAASEAVASLPTPPTRPRSQPGAYATAPGMAPARRTDTSAFSVLVEHEEPEEMPPAATPNTNNDGLATARPVEEEHLVDTEAQPVNEAELEKKKREGPCLIFGLWIVALAALAISLGFVFGNKKDEKDSNDRLSLAPSVSPSQAPTAFSDALLELFPIATRELVQEFPGSYQSQAFQWVLEDPLLLEHPEWRIVQKTALATLYYATSGDEWYDNTHWLDHAVHECTWYHKPTYASKDVLSTIFPGYLRDEFDDDPSPPPVCTEEGVFQHLWIDSNNLQGTIPEELYLLASLETLSMAQNGIQGTLSTAVGAMASLQGLCVFQTRLSGTVPSELGLLSDTLRSLGLNNNNLEQEIPEELWNLTNLQSIGMNGNPRLYGSIPTDIGLLTNLRWILWDDTNTTGVVPSEIALLPKLEWFMGTGNQMTGTLPTQVGLLSSLLLADFNENQLTGTLPTELGLLTTTTLLGLRGNDLSGSVPSELGLLTNMSFRLVLSNNPNLSGQIPTELGLLSNLYELNLGNNQHTGPIPSELGLLASLGRLELANNDLTGTIPPQLSSLQGSMKLYSLELQGNSELSGTIPEGVCIVNKSCAGHALNICDGEETGLQFDCSEILCGCDCPCPSN